MSEAPKRVVVTGAAGFLGRHLLPSLIASGKWSITAITRSDTRPSWLSSFECRSADICNERVVRKVIAETMPHCLIHLAGSASGTASKLCQDNVIGTSNVLQSIRNVVPACRMILLGSAAEYGVVPETAMPITETALCTPKSSYGLTKLAATHLALECARSWNARTTIVRPFNIVGAYMPSHLVAGALIDRIHKELLAPHPRPIRIGRVDTFRDFVAVDDVVWAITRLLDIEESGEIYNLCSGQPTRIADLLQTLLSIAGDRVSWETDPILIRDDDVLTSYGSCEKAGARINFSATVSLKSALHAAWEARLRNEPA